MWILKGLLVTLVNAAAQDCTNPCIVGKGGLGPIDNHHKTHDICANYASRVIDKNLARDCGHTSLADALEKCTNTGKNIPPQCFLHRAAGTGIVVAQNAAALFIWLPIIWKILQMREAKRETKEK